MGLLSKMQSLVHDGAVAAPVADRCECMMCDALGNGPACEYNRLQRLDPPSAAGGHGTIGIANRLADRHKVRMSVQPHVDPLFAPALDERRVEIEIGADWSSFEKIFVREHSGDVDQDVGLSSDIKTLLI